jgi:dethiobiotin synthetase
MSKQQYIVTGIGTDVGKTIVSAILTEKLQADYWKPVQAGIEQTDAQTIQSLISNKNSVIHPSKYILKTPASPHYAAELENIHISVNDLQIPETDNDIIIEGAGGIMVPLNNRQTFLDIFKFWQLPVIVVSKHYLGSINHTLMSLNVLQQAKIPVKGIIFVGEQNPSTEEVILGMTGVNNLGRINHLNNVNPDSIKKAGENISL